MHSNRRILTSEITKTNLILEILRFWKERFSETKVFAYESQSQQVQHPLNEEEFPINLLARKFTEWFFRSFNEYTLKNEDFYADAELLLRTKANDGEDEQKTSTPSDILSTIYRIKNQFGFSFEPNVTHVGVQGRMSPHGITLVLGCGTLHTVESCVGIFESCFAIIKDPFSENNWKIKTLQMQLKSSSIHKTYALEDTETLKDALTLPVNWEAIE